MTPEQILEPIKKEFGSVLAAVPEMQKRQKEMDDALKAADTRMTEELKKRDDAINDLLARLQRGEQITQDKDEPGFHLDGRGTIRPRITKEFSDFVTKVFKNDVREMASGVGADGGFLIAPEYLWQLQTLLTAYGVARQEALVVPMSSNSLIFPNLVSSVQTYFITENQPATESFPTFSQVQLDAKTLVALTHISAQLLADSNIDLGSLLLDLFSRNIAYTEDFQTFVGTGAGADPFTGALLTSGTNVVQLSTGKTAFTDIHPDDLLAMTTKTPTPALPNAKFYMHRSIFDVVRKLKTTQGEYIVSQPTTSGAVTVGNVATLWGYPVVLVEVMPDTGSTAVNKPFILFGNMKHVLFGDRQSPEIARSEQFAFTKLQTFVRIHERFGVKTGRPDALTIAKTAAS
jgi:HK97 family phage major capsid protein